MKQQLSTGIALLLILSILTGCSGRSQTEEPAVTEEPVLLELSQTEIPVTIDDHEILAGRTTIQELLDDGFRVMISKWQEDRVVQHEVDPKEVLEPGVNYHELFIEVADSAFMRLSVRTEEEGICMGDAPITRVELHLSHVAETLPDNILLCGVPVKELTREKARTLFPDFEQEDLSVYSRGVDYKCNLMFSPSTLILYQFSLRSTIGDAPEPEIKKPSIW